jgi:hypothetical protein
MEVKFHNAVTYKKQLDKRAACQETDCQETAWLKNFYQQLVSLVAINTPYRWVVSL